MTTQRSAIVLCLVVLGLLFAGTGTGWGATESPTVLFDKPTHFTASDGTDVLVAAGAYRIEESSDTQLRLVANPPQPAIEIQAIAMTHKEPVKSSLALAIAEEGEADEVHLVLLLPDGRGLDAVGTFSGTRSRGNRAKPINQQQMQQAMNQIAPYSQPPSPSPLLPVPPAATTTAAPPRPSVAAPGPGKWITWNYLAMNHPIFVAQALADVQTGKRPLATLSGLASYSELTELLKTNWGAEVANMKAGVTPRGVPGGLILSDQVTAKPSVKMPVTPAETTTARNPIAFPVALPPRDLGAAWSGQRNTTTVMLTSPFDGYLEALLDLETTKRRFRIVKALSYTGELANGQPMIAQQVLGGNYNDVRPKAPGDTTLVSMAGFVTLNVKRGQLVSIEIAFEPDSGYGPPVGNYEVTLEVDGFSQTGARSARTLALRARSLGINFGILAYAEQGHADTLTNKVVEMPIVLTNAAATPWAGAITGAQLPPGVTMDPVPVSFPGQGTQRYMARFRISEAAQDGPAQPIVVRIDGAGQTRSVNLSMSIYHPWLFWCFGYNCYETRTSGTIPGGADSRCCSLGNDWSLNQTQVWIRDDGQWWWQVDASNRKGLDVGGTDFNVHVAFNANAVVRDSIHVHIGPNTYNQTYEQSHLHPWIHSNFMQAAQTGVSFEIDQH